MIGGAEALSATIFEPSIAYAALGHLHLAQRVGKNEHMRYSGSPLPLSFAEMDYKHQILCVDLAGETLQEIVSIKVPRAVELLRIPKLPAPLEEVLGILAALDLPAAACNFPYLEVRVRLAAPEPGLRARIEAALANKPVRLARIETTFAASVAEHFEPKSIEELNRLLPEDIYNRLYLNKFGTPAPPEQLAAFAELLQEPAEGALR